MGDFIGLVKMEVDVGDHCSFAECKRLGNYVAVFVYAAIKFQYPSLQISFPLCVITASRPFGE